MVENDKYTISFKDLTFFKGQEIHLALSTDKNSKEKFCKLCLIKLHVPNFLRNEDSFLN